MPAGIDDVDDALDADVEHEIGRAVEEFGAVDEGEMMHLVDAAHGGVDRGGIADIACDEFDVAVDAGQAPRRAARIVVEHAHGVALAHERLHQRGADEAAAAGHQDAAGAHARSSAAWAISIQRPVACARRAASIRHCTR